MIGSIHGKEMVVVMESISIASSVNEMTGPDVVSKQCLSDPRRPVSCGIC